MSKNILRLHFNFSTGEPDIAEMPEILLEAGFRPLTLATQETLPSGSVVVVFDQNSNQLSPLFIIGKHFRYGFSYMLFNDLNNNPDVEYLNNFQGKYYRVLFQLTVVDDKPQLSNLPQAIDESGFRPLDKATPEDLPEGSIALLYSDTGVLTPVIVRVLSTSNKRLLYLRQGIVAGHWESKVIMDSLKPFTKYSYLVIS